MPFDQPAVAAGPPDLDQGEAERGTRHEALEPTRQGVTERLREVGKKAAEGLRIRHDHGSPYMSRDFQTEIAWPGATASPAFVRAPRATAAPSGSSRR